MIATLISWALFGLIAGVLAKWISPGKENMSILMTILLGVVGAFVGGAIAEFVLGWEVLEGSWSLRGFFIAVAGASLVLFVYERFVAGKNV